MTALPAPRRRPRPFWGDARFLLGIVLIAASIAGVWLVVAAARQTTPVLAAARTIVPGETLDSSDFRAVEVALGAAGDAYLRPQSLDDGAVATRVVAAGELVPAAAIGAADDARVTSIVVDAAADVPESVTSGTRVELWSAPPGEEPSTYLEPRILVPEATVAAVRRDDGALAGSGVALELVIPRADVAAALAALADGSVLSVVPIAGVAP
ncbi:SAF domain-containing protein [Microbacterium sp. 10M-3C3]|jgi:hypothetical protein|uniref:SAF domain-containing protein n=1 Tax=Microbacterium sp. 10M-3C3 TaxID=2483401 RepID=UPI000F63C976|nr:SAF domain-containing protein [Microbacterium sp. 10M-3C3]